MRHRVPSPPLSAPLSLLLLLAFIAPALAVDPERVHLIDHAGHNFLFRTGDPTVPSNPGPVSFAYAELDAAFRSVAAASNLSLPSKYYLVDICLLSYELVEINTEVQFFKANASLGEFKSWPTFGTVINAMEVPELLRKEMAIYWEGNYTADHLPERVAALRSMVQTQTATPTVFMIHCTAGEDRTGELSGSYYITYQNMSFADALTLDDSINPDENGRSISCLARNGFQWYCLHLLYTGKYNLDDCAIPAALPSCTMGGR